MTKAKTTSRPADEAVQSNINPSTAAAKKKSSRSKATPSDEGRAKSTATNTPTERPPEVIHTAALKLRRQTKAALLRARLADPGGVSLSALIEATGWQAHTLRAYLSGLRKEGLTLTRRREGDVTIYAIDPSGSAVEKTAGEKAEQETASKAPREAKTEDVDAGAADPAAACHSAGTNA